MPLGAERERLGAERERERERERRDQNGCRGTCGIAGGHLRGRFTDWRGGCIECLVVSTRKKQTIVSTGQDVACRNTAYARRSPESNSHEPVPTGYAYPYLSTRMPHISTPHSSQLEQDAGQRAIPAPLDTSETLERARCTSPSKIRGPRRYEAFEDAHTASAMVTRPPLGPRRRARPPGGPGRGRRTWPCAAWYACSGSTAAPPPAAHTALHRHPRHPPLWRFPFASGPVQVWGRYSGCCTSSPLVSRRRTVLRPLLPSRHQHPAENTKDMHAVRQDEKRTRLQRHAPVCFYAFIRPSSCVAVHTRNPSPNMEDIQQGEQRSIHMNLGKFLWSF